MGSRRARDLRDAKRCEVSTRGKDAPGSSIGSRGGDLEDGAFLHSVIDGNQIVGHTYM